MFNIPQEREARDALNPNKRRRPPPAPVGPMSREERLRLRAERHTREGSSAPTTEGMSEEPDQTQGEDGARDAGEAVIVMAVAWEARIAVAELCCCS